MEMAAGKRGHLIAFEGLDKAGKSTQCAKLVENLQKRGRRVQHIRFPNRSTPIGKMIDAYLKGDSTQEDHVIHLLFSANRWEAAYETSTLQPAIANPASAEIEARIKDGVDIVLDRYYYSGCVYSAAKQNPTLDLRWARLPEQGLPRPDICVFLSISAEDAAKRGGYGDERYEQEDMQARVRQLFRQLELGRDGDDFVVVDGGMLMSDVEVAVLSAVEDMMATVVRDRLPLRSVEP